MPLPSTTHMAIRQEKPKFTRASTSKVRTGCLTCKTRHKKCDEEKPTCRRCRVSQVKCDGYSSPDEIRAPRKKTPPQLTCVKKHPVVESPLALQSLDPGGWDGDHLARSLFSHFRTCTVADLALLPYPVNFWERHVLPLGNAAPVVRQAAIALGASHRTFLMQSSGWLDSATAHRQETITLRQYNEAIRQLLSTPSSGSPADIRVILVCCLLFYCLENVRGRSSEAIQHLKSGSQLLLSLPPKSKSGGKQGESGCDDAISEIADMFARLGVSAALYTDHAVVPDLSCYRTPDTTWEDDVSQPFADFAAARCALWDLDIDHTLSWTTIHDSLSHRSTGMPITDNSQLSPTLEDCDLTCFEASDRALQGRFRRWCKRFDKTVTLAKARGFAKREWQEITLLTMRQLSWQTILDEVPTGDPGIADAILEQAEMLIRMSSSDHPIFTLESDILTTTSFVSFYSEEERHRKKAVEILRSARIREGVWDSEWLAQNIEDQYAMGKPKQDCFETTSSE